MTRKGVYQHCKHLISRFCKLERYSEDWRVTLAEIKDYIPSHIVEALAIAIMEKDDYVEMYKVNHIRSANEEKLLEMLQQENLEISSFTRDKLLLLSQQHVLELVENDCLRLNSIVDCGIHVLENVLDDENAEAIIKEDIDIHTLIRISEHPIHLEDYLRCREMKNHSISYIIKAYEDNPLRLTFMACDDPVDLVYDNYDNEELVLFATENHYIDKDDVCWIMGELNNGPRHREETHAGMIFRLILEGSGAEEVDVVFDDEEFAEKLHEEALD